MKGIIMNSLTRRELLVASLAASAAGVQAQVLGERPIRLIVPFAPGGANDLIARALQKPMGELLGAPIVVMNMPGGSTKVATNELLRAAPDGHTLMLAGHAALLGYYYSGGIYDTKFWHQLTILGQTGRMPYAMIETRAESPFKTWKDVVAYGKANPGKLSVGGPAQGGMMNLIAIETAKAAGIDVVYVPYRGGGPSAMAMLAGEVSYRVGQPPEVYPNVVGGKSRALAVAFPTRIPEMPDVPTLKEVGMDVDVPVFGFDVWGPPQMAPAVARKITDAIKEAIKDPDYIQVSKRLLYQPQFAGPDELKASMQRFETDTGPKMEAAFPHKS
jgi:tripartite-type tricarboxylate transporter receptor subunit TctC